MGVSEGGRTRGSLEVEGRMSYTDLREMVESLQPQLTPMFLAALVTDVIDREGEDVGGGVNALRLVKHLLSNPQMRDAEAVWAYDKLKPGFRVAFEQIPSLYYFEGD